jgi:hypothetical protein
MSGRPGAHRHAVMTLTRPDVTACTKCSSYRPSSGTIRDLLLVHRRRHAVNVCASQRRASTLKNKQLSVPSQPFSTTNHAILIRSTKPSRELKLSLGGATVHDGGF